MATLVLLRTFESEVEARVVESFLLAAGLMGTLCKVFKRSDIKRHSLVWRIELGRFNAGF